MRRKIAANLVANVSFERVIQFYTWPENDEERHVVASSRTFQADDQAIEHLRYVFYDAIDLTAAHTNALAVNGRVGSAIDYGASPGSNLHPVAMPPNTWKHLKVAFAITLIFGIVPEEQGHGWHRFGDYQFSHFIDEGMTVVVEGFYFCS